jgi:hypothetical protein
MPNRTKNLLLVLAFMAISGLAIAGWVRKPQMPVAQQVPAESELQFVGYDSNGRSLYVKNPAVKPVRTMPSPAPAPETVQSHRVR